MRINQSLKKLLAITSKTKKRTPLLCFLAIKISVTPFFLPKQKSHLLNGIVKETTNDFFYLIHFAFTCRVRMDNNSISTKENVDMFITTLLDGFCLFSTLAIWLEMGKKPITTYIYIYIYEMAAVSNLSITIAWYPEIKQYLRLKLFIVKKR